MSRPITRNLPFVFVLAVALSGFSARQSLAGGQECVECVGVTRICLEWSQPDPPQEGTDFGVDCTVPGGPDIELRTGDPDWRIDSFDLEIFERGNIGTLTIDPSSPPEIFDVTIVTDTGYPGAKYIESIALVSGAPWTGHSSVRGAIREDLARLWVQEDSAGNGGEVDFIVEGDVTGDLGIPDLVSLTIEGELKASATINFMSQVLGGPLTIEGGGAGTIENILWLNSTVTLASGSGRSWDGTITVGWVFANGMIQTTFGAHVNGVINVLVDSSGLIVVAGNMSGEINVGDDIFRRITIFLNLRGEINIGGDVISPGGIKVFDDLDSGGRILVEGSCAGDIDIEKDLKGDVQIDGDLLMGGSVLVRGALAAAALAGAGRIMVSGACNGDITIRKQTDNLTLIHLLGGLDTNAAVQINTSGGTFNAGGDIHVGPATPPDPLNDITFDGCIRIHDDGAGGGGDLRGGTITIIGCHNPGDLNICLDGGDGGENIYIKQQSCPNQVDWSCGTCP